MSHLVNARRGSHLAAVIDVETTGWSARTDEIVEIGVVLFSFDGTSGEITGQLDSYSGLREPRVGIHPAAREVHGLSLETLKGHALDEERLCGLFNRAEFLVAHNAPFDRGFVTRLFPYAAEKPWLCSMRSVDWLAHGCPGRSLEFLRSHFGLQDRGHHRAAADAGLTLTLLSMLDDRRRPFFVQLLEHLPRQIAGLQRPCHESTPVMPQTRPQADLRYRRLLTENVTQSFGSGLVGITLETKRSIRRDPHPATRELMDLLAGIVADGVVTAGEFRVLDQWLMMNGELSCEYPVNVLARQLSTIIARGRLDVAELQRLHEVALQILHPRSLGYIDLSTVEETPITQPLPSVSFVGKVFVFTGNFYYGEKSECEQATIVQGGITKKGVTRTTDYVVVGGKGSPEWSHGSYGSKIEKAVANIRGGCLTAIISEEHWAKAVARVPSDSLAYVI